VKRTGRGESIGAVIYICMGTTKWNSLCSYLYLKLAKHHVSHFILYVFPSTKSKNRRVGQVGGGWCWWEGGGGRERRRKINMVQTVYIHVCKCKNETCWNCSRNQGREDGGE
jgi:hypothetical protein